VAGRRRAGSSGRCTPGRGLPSIRLRWLPSRAERRKTHRVPAPVGGTGRSFALLGTVRWWDGARTASARWGAAPATTACRLRPSPGSSAMSSPCGRQAGPGHQGRRLGLGAAHRVGAQGVAHPGQHRALSAPLASPEVIDPGRLVGHQGLAVGAHEVTAERCPEQANRCPASVNTSSWDNSGPEGLQHSERDPGPLSPNVI
jgi:hypothetical protein